MDFIIKIYFILMGENIREKEYIWYKDKGGKWLY